MMMTEEQVIVEEKAVVVTVGQGGYGRSGYGKECRFLSC